MPAGLEGRARMSKLRLTSEQQSIVRGAVSVSSFLQFQLKARLSGFLLAKKNLMQ
jgi:hypothetical protein